MLRTGLRLAARTAAAARVVKSPKAWTASSLRLEDVMLKFPAPMLAELQAHIQGIAANTVNVDDTVVNMKLFPETTAFFKNVEKDILINGPGLCIVPALPFLRTVHEHRVAYYVYTNVMGEALVQNAEGHKSVLVYDRDASRTMADGARYHQSHEGGSLHTDNVNVPDTWEHMFLVCLNPAKLGGENICVSVATVCNYMLERCPEALDILAEDFFFEFRGFSEKFYKAPVLYLNKFGEPALRYLRDYLESAHKRLGQPLSPRQRWALDCLSTTAELSELQFRHTFNVGEALLCNDMQTLHGRTSFIDAGKATLQYDFRNPVNRLMQRTWIQSSEQSYRRMNQSRFEVL